jgi:hypothetical protein
VSLERLSYGMYSGWYLRVAGDVKWDSQIHEGLMDQSDKVISHMWVGDKYV